MKPSLTGQSRLRGRARRRAIRLLLASRVEEEFISASGLVTRVGSAAIILLAWRCGLLESVASHLGGAVWVQAVVGLVMALFIVLIGTPLLVLALSSTPVLVLRCGGVGALDTGVVRSAQRLLEPLLDDETEVDVLVEGRARSVLRLCRLWLWKLNEVQRERFFAVANVTDCTLQELRTIVSKL